MAKHIDLSGDNIILTPNSTGNVKLGNFNFDGDQTVGAGQDNYVLTYDNGTGLISLEAAAGGGADPHKAAYPSTPGTSPTASGAVAGTLAFGDNAQATGSTEPALAIGYNTIANGRAAVAVGVHNVTYGASGSYTVAIGRNASATNTSNIAIGNLSSATTGTSSLAIGAAAVTTGSQTVSIGNSATTSGISSIAIGQGSSASNGSVAIGSNSGTAATGSEDFMVNTLGVTSSSGFNIGILGVNQTNGSYNITLGSGHLTAANNVTNCITIGQQCNNRDKSDAIAFGHKAVNLYHGQWSWQPEGFSDGYATAQTNMAILKVITTNATPTELQTPGSGYLITGDNQTILYDIDIVARRTDATGESAGYNLKFVCDRDTGVASHVIVGSVAKTVVAEDTAAWDVTVTNDTTNGRPAITVTGEASKTIRWVAYVRATQVENV